jgi:WXG100 family type VII secretion target
MGSSTGGRMTGDDSIGADFATLETVSGEISDMLKELTTHLDTLHYEAERVVNTWHGEARDACKTALDRWNASVGELKSAQGHLRDVVVTGHANYRAASSALVRGWGGE